MWVCIRYTRSVLELLAVIFRPLSTFLTRGKERIRSVRCIFGYNTRDGMFQARTSRIHTGTVRGDLKAIRNFVAVRLRLHIRKSREGLVETTG